MNQSRSIIGILIIAAAIAIAVVIGVSLVTAQLETIGWIVGSLVLIICTALGRRVWLILPFLGGLTLTFRVPGLPTSLLLAQLLFIGFTTLLLLARKLPFRFKLGELEWWVLLLVAMIVQVYFRNPVGLGITGGDSVGGRAYVMFGLSTVVFFMLSSYIIPARELFWYVWASISSTIVNFGLNVTGRLFPSVGVWYGAVGGFASEEMVDPERASRIGFLGSAARDICLWVSAFISPLKAITKPLWLGLILLSLAFAAMSGFRNAIAFIGLTYCMGLLYRGGFIHFAASAVLGCVAVVLLAVANLAFPLPPNAQRALSFLPGTWDQHIVRDAENSIDWRYEVWLEVLTTDRWIANKWIGDGLGFTRQELQAQMALMDTTRQIRTISGFDQQRDFILANADYHSGPVQTIRIIGYVGLAVLLLAMFRLAVHAHHLMRRYRNTHWYPLVLFVGIPCIVYPLFFTFIFGTFQIGAATFMTSAAMVRILQRNLPSPEDGVSAAA